MAPVPPSEFNNDDAYYIPHHAVIKKDNPSKIRVVFNASQKTRTGLSLNDTLHTGPSLQNEIAHVLIRWRCFKFVFCTDIVKMYRQFETDPADRNYLRILYTFEGQLQHFRLCTVTYSSISSSKSFATSLS